MVKVVDEFAFVDAAKENFLNHHEKVMKLEKVGRIIIYDYTLWEAMLLCLRNVFLRPKRTLQKAIFELNKSLAVDPRLEYLLLHWVSRLTKMEESRKHSATVSKGLLQSEELYRYILETSVYPREQEYLKEIRDITANHPKAVMGTAPDAGQLIALLLKLIGAKKIIEIGVFTGYSLLLTALTIPEDGKIVAIDMDRESYEMGLPVIKRAGVHHKINFIESEAIPVLDQLLKDTENEGSFDYVFVDADKENYWNYHERVMKLLKVGGIAVYDNTLWVGTVAISEEQTPEILKEDRQPTLELNKSLAADPRIQLSHVPLGDGITICRRIY
ncbi:Caffeoyl-CoA O-methyltransferase [Melia azedarach]|uniref:Caffeoyl-CoA O-methyltransferase n=1 Tax=Melia azedarach TaxID=155640 RepID=A0ACC1XCV8_MELAZ|nr:Caffeoyl-CoA O-methyltransferase [Melia azedarach]